MTFYVGVDVGGTTTTVTIGGDDHNVLYVSDQFATRASDGPQATIAAIVEQVQQGMQGLDATVDRVSALGLATPGPATLDGILLKTPNLDPTVWDRYPIRLELEKELKKHAPEIAVHYVGDGQAAALGEYVIRKGDLNWESKLGKRAVEDVSSLFMVIVGTGLGGGEVRNGQVVRGLEGRAGHAGHVLLPEFAFRHEHDRQLVVGNTVATMESAVSLTGLTHQLEYRLSLPDWKDHALNQQSGSSKDKAKQLRNLADDNDALALQLFDDQAKALGIGLLSINYLGDYDLVVIGGGVCDLSEGVRERYRKTAEDAYRTYCLDGFKNLTQFEFSACGDDAPVMGAIAHAYAMNK